MEENLSPLERLAHAVATCSSINDDSRDEIIIQLKTIGAIPEGFEYDLEQVIKRYLIENGGVGKFLDIASFKSSELAGLANLLRGQADYCPYPVKKEVAVDKLMEAVPVLSIRPHRIFRGIGWIERRLEDRATEWASNQAHQNLSDLAGVGWKYLETVFKVCLSFYARALSQDAGGSVSETYTRIVGKIDRPLPTLLQHVRSLEKSYASSDAEQARKACQWWLGRPSPFCGLLEGQEEYRYRGKDLPEALPIHWRKKYASLGGKLPSLDILDEQEVTVSLERYRKYLTDVDRYRHFYAHKDEQVALAAGVGRASQSFDAARAILARIATEAMCPVLLVPVEHGVDIYGRQVLNYLPEQQLVEFEGEFHHPKLGEDELLRFVYLDNSAEIQASPIELGKHYLSFPSLYDGMYAPRLYLLDDILTQAGLAEPVEAHVDV